MDTEYNNLLESLEDIVGQMQMEKLKTALEQEGLRFEKKKPKKDKKEDDKKSDKKDEKEDK